MTRQSNNQHDREGALVNGYCYDLQAWITNYIIQDCGHRQDCSCNGRRFKGRDIRAVKKELILDALMNL